MYKRHLTASLQASLSDTPIVLLNGARQTGKSTLAKHLLEKNTARYFTLDDLTTLAAAQHDPSGFIKNLSGPVIIDEVQRAPELFLPIKAAVDEQRQPGQFLLTGSANVLLLPRLSDTLAGRIAIHTLWPLSQGELSRHPDNFIDLLFSKKIPVGNKISCDSLTLIEKMLRGGYPEAILRTDLERRQAWFNDYTTTVIHREIKDLAEIEGVKELPHLLSLLATRIGGLLNYSELSRSVALPQTTLKRYFTLLEASFLLSSLPPWSKNLGKRLVKAPKIYLNDSGLACQLIGANYEKLKNDKNLLGHLLENFVINEIQKQCGWNKTKVNLFHYRSYAGEEIDLLLEKPSGQIVGIEIKARNTITADDFATLKKFSDENDHFLLGIVLYAGDRILPFGKNLFAMPISAVWH